MSSPRKNWESPRDFRSEAEHPLMAERRVVRRQNKDKDSIVLIHSPLVGPLTWEALAVELRGRGEHVIVPDLSNVAQPPTSFWEQHARDVEAALRDVPHQHRLVLVGHSGAGALLPAIGHAAGRSVAAYLFVDAHIPQDGQTRLGSGPFAAFLRELYAAGGRYPNWTDEDLREILSDPELRQGVLADLRPPPLGFWEEPIPVFPSWPDAPCGYVRFAPNPAYDEAAADAQRRGWAYVELPGGHFHMLVDPTAVADALFNLLAQLTVPVGDDRMKERAGTKP